MTGTAGFIGRHVAAALVSRDIDVSGLLHTRPAADGAVRHVHGDLADGSGIAELLSDADAVIHCASYVGPDETLQQRVNITGTKHLLAAAERAGVTRIVSLSTAGVYGGLGARGTEETLVPAPTSALSRSRLTADQLVLEAGGVVVRPNAVVGAGDRWYLSQLLGFMLKHDAWIDGGVPRVSAIDAPLLGEVLAALALSRPEHNLYLAAAPHPVTIRELVVPVITALGRQGPARSIDADQLRNLASNLGVSASQLQMVAQDNVFDTSRLWNELPGLARDVNLSDADIDWYVRAVRP